MKISWEVGSKPDRKIASFGCFSGCEVMRNG